MPDLARARLRSRLEAMLLDRLAATTRRDYGRFMTETIGAMSGTVVEIGPGTGLTMRYYAPGTKVIGIEPNPVMHERLRAEAAEHGVDLEIRTLVGEQLDVADSSADGAVGSRVLCGVDDPGAVLAEVLRILRPGAPYYFLEHVAAPPGTATATAQRIFFRPHRWLLNGCEVTRTTAATIGAAGFSDVDMVEVDEGAVSGYVRHHIVGRAVR